MIRFTPGELATRIVILDGRQRDAAATMDMLISLGLRQVTVVHSAAAALQLVLPGAAGLVIADLDLAPCGGLDLCLAIRRGADVPDRAVPVIAVTRAATHATVNAARDAGVNAILVRPFSPVDLAARLATVLRATPRFILADGFVGPDRRRKILPIRGRERRFGGGRPPVLNRPAADWLKPLRHGAAAPAPSFSPAGPAAPVMRTHRAEGAGRGPSPLTVAFDDRPTVTLAPRAGGLAEPAGRQCFPIHALRPGMQVAGSLPFVDPLLPRGADIVLSSQIIQRLQQLSAGHQGPAVLWIQTYALLA